MGEALVMMKVRRRHREFEIGTLKRRNSEEVGLVVFDPLVQSSQNAANYLVLYEVAEDKSGEFRTETIRGLLGEPTHFSREEIERAVDAYCRAACIDPEAEWLKTQLVEAGLSCRVSSYADLLKMVVGEPSYEQLLGTAEWLLRRASILERDGYRCVLCSASRELHGRGLILQVHHRYYVIEWLPWEYPGEALATLCMACHRGLHEQEKVPTFHDVGGKLVKANSRPCIRCLGAGFFPQYRHIQGGVCFECGGARFVVLISDAFTGQPHNGTQT